MTRAWAASVAALARRRSVLLCYHGVGPVSEEADPGFLRVAPDAFRSHVDVLGSAGFEFVTVSELAERARGGVPPRGLAAISFDDGLVDNCEVALPILSAYGVPATVYVISGLIGQPNPWLQDGSRMMRDDELSTLLAAGWELGAHTVSHPDLATLDYEGCLREMRESRAAIKRLTGADPITFAYPFCSYGPAAKAAARDAGFRAAVTCTGRGSWDPFELKRALIWGKDGWPSFVLKLADVYQPLFDSSPGRVYRAATRDLRRRLRRVRS